MSDVHNTEHAQWRIALQGEHCPATSLLRKEAPFALRFLLDSAVSPYTGALAVPAAALPGSFGPDLGTAGTPCSEWSSGASTASIASHAKTCGRLGAIDMQDTPACRTVPGQQPITAALGTAGKV